MTERTPSDENPPDSTAQVREAVFEALVASEMSTLDEPHIVACRLRGTRIVSYLGPFPTGMDALAAAEADASLNTPEDDMEYQVVALVDPKSHSV